MALTGHNDGEVYQFLEELETGVTRSAPTGVSSGSIGYGAGGPAYLDDFKTKRAPLPMELVNAYKSVAYSCINLNANAVAKVPLRLYAKTGRGQMKPRLFECRELKPTERSRLVERLWRNTTMRSFVSGCDDVAEVVDCDHPLLKVLAQPNSHFDANLLIQYLVRTLDVLGIAYWYPEKVAPGFAPYELWPLHSQYVTPVKGTGKNVLAAYEYLGEQYQPDELIRFRFISMRDPYLSGYAPLHACFEQLKLVGYYTSTVEDILTCGARPSMIIGPKDPNQPWGEQQRARMEVRINNRFSRGNQGKAWVVDGAFEAKPLSLPPADLGGAEINRGARLVAANCFDVPISMLETEDSNKATASEGSIQHQRNAVEPRCTLIAAGLTIQLAQLVDDRLFFAFDNPVQADRKLDAEVHKIYIDTQVLVPNEVRADLGYEPREGGDEPIKAKPAASKEPAGKEGAK